MVLKENLNYLSLHSAENAISKSMSYVEVIRENGAKKGLKKYNKRVSSS
jgi:hypothetical protein